MRRQGLLVTGWAVEALVVIGVVIGMVSMLVAIGVAYVALCVVLYTAFGPIWGGVLSVLTAYVSVLIFLHRRRWHVRGVWAGSPGEGTWPPRRPL